MSGHDARFDDAVPAYLLGALEADEVVAFEAHLAGCEACRREVAHLKVATDALPVGVAQVAAPRELKDRIMAVVNAEASLLRAAGPASDRVEAPAARAPRRGRLLAGWLGRPSFALAAVLLVLVVGGFGGAAIFGGGGDGGTRTVVAQTAPPGAKVKLLLRKGDGHSTLTASGLPSAGAGRVYQVWLRKGKGDLRPTDALFTPSASGAASVDVPGKLASAQDVLVTSEPDGGSRTPSRSPIIQVSTA